MLLCAERVQSRGAIVRCESVQLLNGLVKLKKSEQYDGIGYQGLCCCKVRAADEVG